MLVSICGPQGSGKSTVLQDIQDDVRFNRPNIVERKTSRSILTDWDVTLQEVYQSNDLMMKFQDALLDRKYQDEVGIADSNELWFTERTFIDLLAYTTANLGRLNECSDWLDEYARRCIEYQNIYHGIVYLCGGSFEIQDDGVRPKNAMYGSMIDEFMLKHTLKSSSNVTVVQSADRLTRINLVAETVFNRR